MMKMVEKYLCLNKNKIMNEHIGPINTDRAIEVIAGLLLELIAHEIITEEKAIELFDTVLEKPNL